MLDQPHVKGIALEAVYKDDEMRAIASLWVTGRMSVHVFDEYRVLFLTHIPIHVNNLRR